MKFTLHFLLYISLVNSFLCQERKINKTIEYIKIKNFESAEETINILSKKSQKSPTVFYVKSILFGVEDYNKFNIDSSFIYYSMAIEEIKNSDLKEQLELCSDYNICLPQSAKYKDSIAKIAFKNYKSLESIEKMKVFNEIYKGTSIIQMSNDFIEELYYKIAKDSNTTFAYLDFLKMYPNSSREKEIISKIHEIEYKSAVLKNDKSIYQVYLDTYPKSVYCDEIQKRIETLDFERTKLSLDLNEFEVFRKEYSNSKYIKELKEIFEIPYFEKVMKEHDINSLNNFKNQFPKSQYLNQVNESICEINFEAVKKINTRDAFKEFLNSFPNSKFEEEAKNKINELFPIVPKLKANGKYVYIDKYTGNDLFNVEFDEAFLYHNNQAIVKINGKYGVINDLGIKVIPTIYDNISNCSNQNLYLVSIGERVGLYNKEGKKLLDAEYEIDFTHENTDFIGFNRFGKEPSGTWPDFLYQIINGELSQYVCEYDELPYFENGYAIVSKGFIYDEDNDNDILGVFALIDQDYKELIPFKYNYLERVEYNSNLFFFNVGGKADYSGFNRSFGDEFYPSGGKWGLININGKIIIPAVFDKLDAINIQNDSTKLFFVANRGRNFEVEDNEPITGNCGLLDINGNEIIPFEYQEILPGGENKLIVNKNGHISYSRFGTYISGGKWGVIDYSNKVKVPIVYDEIQLIQNNYVIRKGSKYGVISSENKVIVPSTFDYIDPSSSDNLILTVLGCVFYEELDYQSYYPTPFGGKWGAFDHEGKVIMTPIYTEILTTSDSSLLIINTGKVFGKEYYDEAKVAGKYGISNRFGKLILPIKYDEINVTSSYIFAKLSDKYQIFNKNGDLVNEKKFDDLTELNNKFIAFRVGEKNGIFRPDLSELIPSKFWATKTEYGYAVDITFEEPYFKIEEAGTYFFATENGVIFKE